MNTYQPFYSSFQPHDGLFGDEELQRRVVSYLVTHAGLAANQIRTSASAGRITLRGEVSSSSVRLLVQACCRRVAGVLDVQNELRVANRSRSSSRRTAAGNGHFLPPRTNPVPLPEYAVR